MSKDMLGGCCVCSDDRGWPENPLVYCDGQGCNVAVHQACYGIVHVPSGPWFCRKCELHERPRCELCPSKEGAFKKTDSNSWAHVVCALYIPEVRFGNVTTMEPILISLIPQERFNKSCYICEEANRGSSKSNFGACMQCNKAGCRSTFHVTCAQMLGLLCEEAGNMMDNVKYCGYCQHHYAKLKATRHVKIIPPYRPIPANNSRSVSPTTLADKAAQGHGQSNKSGNGSTEDGKSGSNNSTPQSGAVSNPQSSSNNDGGKANSNISPDINTSCSSKANNKNSKKGTSYHGGNGGKSSSNNLLDNKSGGNTTTLTHDKNENKGKSHGHGKEKESGEHPSSKCEDNLAVKLERLDEKVAAKTGFPQKKDFSTIQLKEVVTAALDRPMVNTPGSKFDNSSSSLTSGLEGPTTTLPPASSSGSSSNHSGRHTHGPVAKIAPPDIKPDVTLTPIPMKPNASSRHTTSKDDDRELGDREAVSLSKSPGANIPFHHSFGAPPKLQNQQVSPDISDATSKGNKPPELTAQEDIPASERETTTTGPPTKRARGISRDDEREREQRRTPTKGRGGRRGSTTGNSFTRREARDGTSAAAFLDDSSFDEVIEATPATNTTTTEKRPTSGRKNGTITRSNKPPVEEPPTPTLSQLSGQIKSGPPPVGLAPHMFGNALNPSSSMAMKMVDTLSEEMEAVVSAGGVPEVLPPPTSLVGIPVPGTSASKPPVANNTPTSPPSSSNNSSASSNNTSNQAPQTLEQLLERQWEQGSQFLMEQAQHLDIAQLLSCLNQLKQDNKALEEHVQSLIQRRDQLTAINARLSIPLGSSSALGSLGGSFSGAAGASVNTSHHNGINGISQNNTSANNIHPHALASASKNPVVNSTPSPQQNDHGGSHHNNRERLPYNGTTDNGRAELVVTHSSQGGSNIHPGHHNHAPSHVGHHRTQMMDTAFNSYGPNVPVHASLSSPHSLSNSHPQSRGGR